MLKDENFPRHIAIIMDGNGRWAKKRGLTRTKGHRAGVNALKEIIKYCNKIGLEYLTVYAFSTENWKRPAMEIKGLMNLLVEYIKKELKQLNKNNVKLIVLGDISLFPLVVRNEIENAVQTTRTNEGLKLSIALNYGGREEIIKAVKDLISDFDQGNISRDDIDKHLFETYLYTSGIPYPDLVIRPGGEQRISNFLLWQIAYSELWFSDCYWPEFTPDNLSKAIEDYSKRKRRFGGI